MKSLAATLLTFIVMSAVYGQDILNTDQYKKGIYLNFEEFKYNSPSLSSTFELIPERNGLNYRLLISDTVVDKKFLKKVWGVNTGEEVYVNSLSYQNNNGFTLLTEIGRYCVFKDKVSLSQKNSGAYHALTLTGGLIGGAIAGAIPTETAIALNMNNGNFYVLRKETMMLILESEPDLLEEYKNHKRKGDEDVIIDYIHHYNARNKDELKRQKPSPATLVIYRRNKRELQDLVAVSVDDSLVVQLPVNDFIELQVEALRDVEACINDMCVTFSAIPENLYFIECGKSAKSGFYLRNVPVNEGEYYLNKVKYQKNKRTSDQ